MAYNMHSTWAFSFPKITKVRAKKGMILIFRIVRSVSIRYKLIVSALHDLCYLVRLTRFLEAFPDNPWGLR